MMPLLDRRTWLQGISCLGLASFGSLNEKLLARETSATHAGVKKKVAAVVTIYRKFSHADVLLGKILKGWEQTGGSGPNLELVSLYVDQFPSDDLSVELAKEHGFRLCKTIREALTMGSDSLAVDGVLSIGEHGDYPWNNIGQHLYPRRRFFEEITATMESCHQVVPVFNDKHPGPAWEDALWMYDRAKQLSIPWMAGSSLPVSYRDPEVELPMGVSIESAVGIGYSGLDIYGIHTLEFLQSLLERRKSAEQGVKNVQAMPLSKLAAWLDQHPRSVDLMENGLRAAKTDLASVLQTPSDDGALFLVDYVDGLQVPIVMASGHAKGIAAAVKSTDGQIWATRVEEREQPYYPHFAFLLKAIETMVHTGKPSYPVERTLLTSGVLDRLLRSRHQGHIPIATPELRIAYQPVDYPHAPGPKLGP